MMWRLVNWLQLLFAGVWSAGWISLALAARIVTGGPRVPLLMARRIWAPGVLLAGGVRLERRGLDRVDFSRPHLFVANHQSLLDIPVLFCSLPVPLRFVAKEKLRGVPFLGRYIGAMGMVYVHLDNRVRGTEAIAEVVALLGEGHSVATFPEGTRGVGGRLGRFKPGALAPAIQAGAEVVPVAIEGAGRVLPRGGFRPRPGRIRLTVGRPISTAGFDLADRAELARRVREEVRALLGGQGAPETPARQAAESGPTPETRTGECRPSPPII